jgi:glycerophosphoryl diester phosphodiesterase
VIWHDPVSPDGRPVIGQTAAELAAGGIGTLDEILAALPAGTGVDMDVKISLADAVDPPERRTHALLAAALRDVAGTRPVLVSSFDPSVPVYLAGQRALAGEVALGLLTSQELVPELGIVAAANLGLDVVCPYVGTLRLDRADPSAAAGVFDTAHRAGLQVMTWTATPEQAVLAAAAGIDAVCVDDVPGTVAALAAEHE